MARVPTLPYFPANERGQGRKKKKEGSFTYPRKLSARVLRVVFPLAQFRKGGEGEGRKNGPLLKMHPDSFFRCSFL